ncbi:MAG: hypothetical protein CMA72_07310 [Euryarchaeota archaeon]|nr:hypothetical protein [Euryarchaeota archaeon]
MKASELTLGMAIKAKKGCTILIYQSGYQAPVPTAGCCRLDFWTRKWSNTTMSDVAVYAGKGKDLGHKKKTTRFVLLDGQLLPFWPQDWRHCEKV